MSRSTKRGEFDPLKIVAGAMLVLLIVLILIVILAKYYPDLLKLNNCRTRGGSCIESGPGTGCMEGTYQEQLSGCEEGEICCMPIEKKPGEEGEEYSTKELEALANALIFTLNKDTTPIADRTTVNLKENTQYDLHIKVNDQLLKDSTTKDKFGPCAVYVKDMREDGKKYLLSKASAEKDALGLIPAPKELNLEEEFFDCTGIDKLEKIELKYEPSDRDVYKDLMLYVILFDKDFRTEYNNCKRAQTPEALVNLTDMYSNTQHWAAMRAYRLKVEPVIKILGLSGEWVMKDQISITCTGPTCVKFELKLAKSENGNFTELLNTCSQDSGYDGELYYIVGTKIVSSGIPLNIDIGGFRLPYQQKIGYEIAKKPITVVKNKADITIDKATMLKTFYKGDTSLFMGDKTYLCVKATPDDGPAIYGVSEQPLKVDAIPPYVDPDKGIEVIYPDPITATGMSTPYYYRQYPVIRVTGCTDFEQSGCTNYDYYIKSGNFVNLRANTADWETGLVALALTESLNALLTYFAEKDAANTICPLMTSSDYIRNTQPEIRYANRGEGIICIRVGDRAGNTNLVWKAIWTPDQMFNRIFASII